jgi:dTDP-4-amino-4,6-dideoxygalactose transaminase
VKVPFNNLNLQWKEIKEATLFQIERLFDESSFILGPDVGLFEFNFSNWIGTEHAIGVSSGTDALKVAALSLDLKGTVGVVTQANTFIATVLGVEDAIPGAEIVLIDCDQYHQIDTEKLEETLRGSREKWDNCIIVPVHLYGHPSNISEVVKLSKKYDCKIIEDASQAHGSKSNNQIVGTFGDAAAFSLYPGKNLGAAGDAGIVTTNCDKIAEKIKLIRNWGSKRKYYYERKGFNNRLDSIQAIVLNEKLKNIDRWNDQRQNVANFYMSHINNEMIHLPRVAPYCSYHTWHVFCIRTDSEKRDNLILHLNNLGIGTNIHYPIPIELTSPYQSLDVYSPNTRKFASEMVSIPMHPFISEDQANWVCKTLNSWRG